MTGLGCVTHNVRVMLRCWRRRGGGSGGGIGGDIVLTPVKDIREDATHMDEQ